MNELASSFIREMIGGVSNTLLNNPVVSWDNGFIRLIAAICALVTLTNIILSIRDTNTFATKSLRFIFFFTLLLMNFGIINPRTFFDFQLGDYEYLNRTEVDTNDAAKTLGLTVMKPKATLDRDIYNAMSRFFDDVAKTVEGGLKGNDGGSESEGEDVQTQAVKNTIFFLWQVRLANLSVITTVILLNTLSVLKDIFLMKPPLLLTGLLQRSHLSVKKVARVSRVAWKEKNNWSKVPQTGLLILVRVDFGVVLEI